MNRDWRNNPPGNSKSQKQSYEYTDHAIRVEGHGRERGSDRFARGEGPTVATWRNNLTALSQRRNLYFIAYWDKIYVYQPAHGQFIGKTPVLILGPREGDSTTEGHIVPGEPEGINHIVVGDLGSDEILLFARDSGTVSAYRTERIFSAIDQCDILGEKKNPAALGQEVECFFSEDVGASAWGLAIHKHARLIAVSSNTTIISVFAFALTAESKFQPDEEDGVNEPSPSEWYRADDAFTFAKVRGWSLERRRTRNIQLCFAEHFTNIPDVSFLNNELDPHGDWLVSTDINNKLLIWKIWDGPHPVSHWHFHPPPHSSQNDDIFNDNQRGWSVLALDPRAFRLKLNPNMACGGPPHRYPSHKAPYDLSFLASRIPDATQFYDFFSISGPPPSYVKCEEGPRSDESFSIPSCSNSEGELETLDEAKKWESEAPVQATDGNEDESSDPVLQTASVPDNSTDTHGNEPEIPYNDNTQYGTNSPRQGMFVAESLRVGWEDSHDDENADNVQPEMVPYLDEDAILPACYLAPVNSEDESSRPFVFSDFPILHFSETHIRLIPGPFASGPSVIFRGALSQVITHPPPLLEACERMNMVHQIPELGIVIAASQKGRVAIISLTEVPGKGKMFRIERILPLESQETFRFRPLVPLLGVAVGPVENHLFPPERENDIRRSFAGSSSTSAQASDKEEEDQQSATEESDKHNNPSSEPMRGRFIREQWHGSEYSRRYRLLLTYYDNTILKYELYYDWPEVFRGPSTIMRPLVIQS